MAVETLLVAKTFFVEVLQTLFPLSVLIWSLKICCNCAKKIASSFVVLLRIVKDDRLKELILTMHEQIVMQHQCFIYYCF